MHGKVYVCYPGVQFYDLISTLPNLYFPIALLQNTSVFSLLSCCYITTLLLSWNDQITEVLLYGGPTLVLFVSVIKRLHWITGCFEILYGSVFTVMLTLNKYLGNNMFTLANR